MSKCKNCGRTFLVGDYIIYNALGCYCADRKNCFNRRKNMVVTKSLKITAEVDGKQVPLDNISTETFEAIKALEKPKEIPVARLAIARYTSEDSASRLLFKPTKNLNLSNGFIYALNLQRGTFTLVWEPKKDDEMIKRNYTDVQVI